jgi:alpha-tubulin suppressor-like RCC1 family protein
MPSSIPRPSLRSLPFVLQVPGEAGAGARVVMGAAGSGHTILLTAGGTIYCIGRGDDGRLGLGEGTDWTTVPTAITAAGEGGPPPRFNFIAAGSYHSAAIDEGGVLYCWGGGMFGKTGLNPDRDAASFIPRPVPALAARHVLHVACGSKHTIALLEPHSTAPAVAAAGPEVWAWGDAGHGVLGLGPTVTTPVRSPVHVVALQGAGIHAVTACGSHSLALSTDGEVYAWGEGRYGRLGAGGEEDGWAPARVRGALAECRVVAIAAGGCHSLALTASGAAFAWGGGEHGQLGTGGTANSSVPVQITALATHFVLCVAAGWSHSMFLAECPPGDPSAAGAPIVFACGNADHGKLGRRGGRALVPERVAPFAGLQVTQLFSYNEHNLVVTAPDGPDALPWDNDEVVLGLSTGTGASGWDPMPLEGAMAGDVTAQPLPHQAGRARIDRRPPTSAAAAYYSRGLDWTRTRDSPLYASRGSSDSPMADVTLPPPAPPRLGPTTTQPFSGADPREDPPSPALGPRRGSDATVGSESAGGSQGGGARDDGLGVSLLLSRRPSAIGTGPRPPPLPDLTLPPPQPHPSPFFRAVSSPRVGGNTSGATGGGGTFGPSSLLQDLAWMVDNPASHPDVIFACAPEEEEEEEGGEGRALPLSRTSAWALSSQAAGGGGGDDAMGGGASSPAPPRPPALLRAHRGILTARCSSFAALFAHQPACGPAAYVPLPDVSRSGLAHLLHALYTDTLPAWSSSTARGGEGEVSGEGGGAGTGQKSGQGPPSPHVPLSPSAPSSVAPPPPPGLSPLELVEFVVLADRFCAPDRLTRLAEARMERTLSVAGAGEVLAHAAGAGPGAAGLKRIALRYAARHFDAVARTQAFKEGVVPRGDLMWELLQQRGGSGPAR